MPRSPSALLLLLLLSGLATAQRPPSSSRIKKLIPAYLAAEGPALEELREEVERVPPLSARDAKRWTKEVRLALHRAKGPRLVGSGQGWFYDEERKKGRYLVVGKPRAKGLVIGLHGGGQGSGSARSAASAWGGAIASLGYIGVFPEVLRKTGSAWGEDDTVAFVFDLIAAAHRTFRFDPDRVYVVGHSMGGYGAWTLSGRFADRFAGAVSFAGSPTPLLMGGKVVGIQYAVLPNRRNLRTWVYHSADDPRVRIPPVRFAVAGLERLRAEDPEGYEYRYVEVDGRGHAFPADGPRPALRWVMAKKRQRHPERIVWEAWYRREGARYWLERTEVPRQGHRLVATHDGKGRFAVTAKDGNTSGVAVLLSDELCDLDEPVELRLGGALVHQGVVERSLRVLLDSARARRDPGLLFCARVGGIR